MRSSPFTCDFWFICFELGVQQCPLLGFSMKRTIITILGVPVEWSDHVQHTKSSTCIACYTYLIKSKNAMSIVVGQNCTRQLCVRPHQATTWRGHDGNRECLINFRNHVIQNLDTDLTFSFAFRKRKNSTSKHSHTQAPTITHGKSEGTSTSHGQHIGLELLIWFRLPDPTILSEMRSKNKCWKLRLKLPPPY